MPIDMNFRDLEYVIEAAKALSFSRAAEACNVSQPSLSAQIKKLEDSLGVPIFIRHKRRIHLSAFGEGFVEQARDILSIRDNMYQSANADKDPLSGDITLGAILTIAPYMFPQIMQGLGREAPKIRLALKEAKTENLLKALLDGSIDAAIISLPSDDNVFESAKLFSEPFYVAVAKDHKLAKRKSITARDLDDQNLILLEEGHCFRAQALEICQSSAAKENDAFRATSLETIRHFVSIGEGITLMPAMARQDHDGIAYIPLDSTKFSRDIGVIWMKSSHKKPQIEKLVSIIRNLAKPVLKQK